VCAWENVPVTAPCCVHGEGGKWIRAYLSRSPTPLSRACSCFHSLTPGHGRVSNCSAVICNGKVTAFTRSYPAMGGSATAAHEGGGVS